MKTADTAQDFFATSFDWMKKKQLLEDLTHTVSEEYVWPFSQSGPAIHKVRHDAPDLRRRGMFASLSAIWIEPNAHGDSLENYLKKEV